MPWGTDLITDTQRLGWDTTVALVQAHLYPRATILELGTEEGFWSLPFARQGHRVVAAASTDQGLQELLFQVEHESLATVQSRLLDPTRLDGISDWDFQGVFCLGPYSRLRSRERRRRCLLECRRVVHQRGIVVVSYRNLMPELALLAHQGVVLKAETYAALAAGQDVRDTDLPSENLRSYHLTNPEAVEAEVLSCGFKILAHSGIDSLGMVDVPLPPLDPPAYQDYLDFHLRESQRVSSRGASRRGVVVLARA